MTGCDLMRVLAKLCLGEKVGWTSLIAAILAHLVYPASVRTSLRETTMHSLARTPYRPDFDAVKSTTARTLGYCSAAPWFRS